MHSLTIAFGEGQMMCWRLLFTSEETALRAWAIFNGAPTQLPFKPVAGTTGDAPQTMEWHRANSLPSPGDVAAVTDDYGQTCMVKLADVKGCMLEDMDRSQLGDIEMRLHGARTQAKAQGRAQADPGLRGGAVVQPFNGGFTRQ
jgi:hypothetical protein